MGRSKKSSRRKKGKSHRSRSKKTKDKKSGKKKRGQKHGRSRDKADHHSHGSRHQDRSAERQHGRRRKNDSANAIKTTPSTTSEIPANPEDAAAQQLLEIMQRNEELELLRIKYKEHIIFKPVEQTPEEIAKDEEPVDLSPFGVELNTGLRYLWVVTQLFFRAPYFVDRGDKLINFSHARCHIVYILYAAQTAISSIVALWAILSIFLFYFAQGFKPGCPKRSKFTNFVAGAVTRRYFLEITICMFTLTYAFFSNLSQLLNSRKYALFCKGWYRLVENSKLRLHFGLRRYILEQLIMIGAMIAATVLIWFLGKIGVKGIPNSIHGASAVMGLAMVSVIQRMFGTEEDYFLDDSNGKFDVDEKWKQYAPLGLMIYIVGIFQGQMSLLLYRVSCKLLSNAGKYYKVRLSHLLSKSSSELYDVNLRLTYAEMYEDLNNIAEQGRKIGDVFDQLLLYYYCLLFFSILLELSVLSFDTYRDRVLLRNQNRNAACPWDAILGNSGAVLDFASHIAHLFVTIVDFIVLTFIAIDASEEAMRCHDIVRRHGLINCDSEEERNFIRSMWCVGDLRRPIIISPGNYFDIHKGFVANVIMGIFLYYVIVIQLRPEFEKTAVKQLDEQQMLYNLMNCSHLLKDYACKRL